MRAYARRATYVYAYGMCGVRSHGRAYTCACIGNVYIDTRKGFTTHYRARARVYRRALCQVGKPILKRHRIFIPRCAESVPIRVYTVCRVLTAPVIVPLRIRTTGDLSMHLGRPIGNHVREGSMNVGRELLGWPKRKGKLARLHFVDSLLQIIQ